VVSEERRGYGFVCKAVINEIPNSDILVFLDGDFSFYILNTFLTSFGNAWPWSYVMILAIPFVGIFTKICRSIGLDARLV